MKIKLLSLFIILNLTHPVYSSDKNCMSLTDKVLSHSTYQLTSLYNQVRKIPDRLPYTINNKGDLVSINARHWTSGFFPGSLWYLYEYSGNNEMRKAALEMTERIREQQYMTTNHDIGFMIFCSFGNALRLTGDKEFEKVIVTAARSLSTRFNDKLGVIRSWDNDSWQYPVIIDNMMNLELLAQATKISGDSSFYKIAESHADTTLKYHFRKDGSSYHLVSYDTLKGGFIERITYQGAYDESAWARGQAWALYGYVMMYRETQKKIYLEQAIKIANFIAENKNLPEDKIPYWDFNAPDIPNALRDASAGAIIASALVELSIFTSDHLSDKFYSLGKQMVNSLASSTYMAEKTENGSFILKHSVAFLKRNREVDVPLNYADYYFLEALNRIRKIETKKGYKIRTQKLTNEHPRLFLSNADLLVLKDKLKVDPVLAQTHDFILKNCDEIIALPLLLRNQQGRRILETSREAFRRVFFLSYAYRVTEENRYFSRAHDELINLANFEDWNPSHFLDVAEMSFALAIGYDWLYHKLPETSLKLIENALLNKGLLPSTINSYNGWLQNTNNWNQVCNGGLVAAAVALYNKYPTLCNMVVNRAVDAVSLSMQVYANDGAYPEGYNYWAYGTTYNLFLLDLLTQNFGSDYGLSNHTGFLKTGMFMQHMEGNFLKSIEDRQELPLSFNFGDGRESTFLNPGLFWFAEKNNDVSLVYSEIKKLKISLNEKNTAFTNVRFLPFLLIWGRKIDLQQVSPPNQHMYIGNGNAEVAMMRTNWVDNKGIYVGVKGGTPSGSHQHMDGGSFVMEANGVRWGKDFGMENYTTLETRGVRLWGRTQNSQRWDVFRYKNSSHNTLTINNNKQLIAGNATITKISNTKKKQAVVTDMTSLYKCDVNDLKRTVSIINQKYVLIEDFIHTNDQIANIRWNMLTGAIPEIINKKTIILTQNGEKLKLKFIGNIDVKASILSTESSNSYDSPNKGTAFVGFDLIVPANTKKKWGVKLLPLN